MSDIVASPQPKLAAEKLQLIISQFRQCISGPFRGLDGRARNKLTPEIIMNDVVKLVEKIRALNPLIHQVCRIPKYRYLDTSLRLHKITNVVVATQSANVTLAVGGSPIMAMELQEMEDLTRICSALLINIGSIRAESLNGMVLAGTGYAFNQFFLAHTFVINKVPLPTISKSLSYSTQLVLVRVLSERTQSRVGIPRSYT